MIGAFFGLLVTWHYIYYRLLLPAFSKKRELKNKVVVITGGANGIGRQLCEKLAVMGCKLIILDIDRTGLTQVQKQLEKITTVHAYTCDVSKYDRVKDVINRARKDIKPDTIDIVINNAAIMYGKPFLQLDPKQVQQTMDVNVLSHFWLNQAILPGFIEQKSGLIVTISSLMSLVGSAGLTDYCATKWAVSGFHESLRLELKRMNCDHFIDTLLVCPYAVNTGMFQGIFEQVPLVQSLMPVLETNDVCDLIIRAMQKNDRVLIGCDKSWRQHVIFP